jgi:adenine phosphoribosyltransferase
MRNKNRIRRVLRDMDTAYLMEKISEVRNFPIDGVGFKDITPLLEDGKAFGIVVDDFADYFKHAGVKKVVGIESRGFKFSGALAYALGVGTVMARKKGKLPRKTVERTHQLEYGDSMLQMHCDSIQRGERALIVDDVLATGGTMKAAIEMVEECGGIVVGLGFLLELPLGGREKLAGYTIRSLIRY